jgi:hydroxymethylpyrimidine/phosphomethylpyrimidine kinase
MQTLYPVVLCFSGHDPSGGAGVQADIETLTQHRCHCASVITALTEQDTRNVKHLYPQSAENFLQQAQTILADLPIAVIKIGLMGSVEIAQAIHFLLQQHPLIPVVLDPILAAGGGASLSNQALIEAIKTQLLPCTTIVTPNSDEARILTQQPTLALCGLNLLEKGCDYVLITGAHEKSTQVENQLFHQGQQLETLSWERLPFSYHGSGCTLASSIAGFMALGYAPTVAISQAQAYTFQTLQAAYKVGQGQHNPRRYF